MDIYKGIIFDLDGTLLDTIEDIGDSMNEALNEIGLDSYTYDEYYLMVGGGFRGLAKNVLPKDSDKETIDKIVDLFTRFYEKNYLNKSHPYVEIVELLERLVEKNIKLAINSNKKDRYTKDLVHKFFGDIPFIRVYGDREGLPIKPDPYSALEISRAMELEAGEILYIGDSNVDIKTAQNAGMASVGVDWGFRGKKELMEYGANYIVDSPLEILDLI